MNHPISLTVLEHRYHTWNPIQLTLHEAMNEPFSGSLIFHNHAYLEPQDLLYQPITVQISINQKTRLFNGIIRSLTRQYTSNKHKSHQITITPSLTLLEQDRQFRIFKQQSAEQIILSLLKQHQIAVKNECTSSLPTTPYSVQYNESSLNYIHRLMAKYGLTYYFSHEPGQHTLVLTDQLCRKNLPIDSLSTHAFSQGQSMAAHGQQTHAHTSPSSHSALAFSAKQPGNPITLNTPDCATKSQISLNHFHYPTQATTPLEANTLGDVQYSQLQAKRAFLTATGHDHLLKLGQKIQLQGQLHAWVITSIKHNIQTQAKLSSSQAPEHDFYEHNLTAVTSDLDCIKPKYIQPHITGVQTAHVIGNTDTTSSQGHNEIAVRFAWSNSPSTWIRKAQTLANNNSGLHFIPRTHQELLLNFLNGDPDHPIATGQLYNRTQTNALAGHTQQTVGICSQVYHQPTKQGHQLCFTQLTQQPLLTIKSQADQVINVGNNYNQQVQRHHHTRITHGNQSNQIIQGSLTIQAPSIRLKHGAQSITMDKQGVHFNGSHIYLLSPQLQSSQAAARMGDNQRCPQFNPNNTPHAGGKITQGSPNVFINGKNAARLGDTALCQNNSTTIANGAQAILVNGQPLARIKDSTEHQGRITQGSSNVTVGGHNLP